jgi:transcriptional regulator
MYLPAHFAETRTGVMHALMRAHPLATIVTLSSSGLLANHIPLQVHDGADPQAPGILRGHVARANPIWSDRVEAVEALVIFQGPQHYISPNWYPSKKDTGKVVPTWNYCCVHAYGQLQLHHDPVWIREQVTALTKWHESGLPAPWAVSDAPAEYLQTMLGNIVGIEIAITRMTGKWKVSQNQPAPNRAGVIEGLSGLEPIDAADAANALAMVELVRRHEPGQK